VVLAQFLVSFYLRMRNISKELEDLLKCKIPNEMLLETWSFSEYMSNMCQWFLGGENAYG
jgi:hypothetical protein